MRDGKRNLAEETGFDLEHISPFLFELSPNPTIAVDGPPYIVRHVNVAFSRLIGTDFTELVGRPFNEVVPEGTANACLELFDRVYSTRIPEVLVEQQHSHTPPVYWSYSAWAIHGVDQNPIGLMIQITDDTEAASFRSDARAMNEQLMLSATRQHELMEIADRANRLKDEFLATLSHELRTPLTSIIGWAEMLKNPILDPATFRRAIEVIGRCARMQAQMIDDLLDVSRIINGKLRIDVQPVDLGTVIIAAIDGLRPAAEAKEIRLRLKLDSPSGQVSGDFDPLQQVMWNLISNAIKFTPIGSTVKVQLKRVGTQVETIISDKGIGISKEFLPFVFDRFRQADATSTRTFGGLGLGLSIVRQLIEQHGGTVGVVSEGHGLGSKFTVSLPILTAANDVVADDKIDSHAGLKCPAELIALRVLVVDDEADICDLLQTILESCGAQVTTTRFAAAALQAVATGEFDVLISDIRMPDDDGYTLIARVRALGKEQGGEIPAAALTAYAGEKDRNLILQSGFQIHIPKPISPGELVAVVANLARHNT